MNQTKKTKSSKNPAVAGGSKTGPSGSSTTKGGPAAGAKNQKEAFQKKLLICQRQYDYYDESKDVKGKTERLNAINEIQQMLQDQKSVVSLIIPNLDDVMTMVEKNIFRPLPIFKRGNLAFSETGVEQEEEVEPSWPHIQGIYEFFLQLVINEAVEVRSLKVYVTP